MARYKIAPVSYLGRPANIVCQDANGPCPLVAACNYIILSTGFKIMPGPDGYVSQDYLFKFLKAKLVVGIHKMNPDWEEWELNVEVEDFSSVWPSLTTGVYVNPSPMRVKGFAESTETRLLEYLKIPLRHGWIIDPEDTSTADAVGEDGFDELNLRIARYNSAEENVDVAEKNKCKLIKEFLEGTRGQLSDYGLSCLCNDMVEGELGILFRNNHFYVTTMHGGCLHTLETDIGIRTNHPRLVWQKLTVLGDGAYLTCDFISLEDEYAAKENEALEHEAELLKEESLEKSQSAQLTRNQRKKKKKQEKQEKKLKEKVVEDAAAAHEALLGHTKSKSSESSSSDEGPLSWVGQSFLEFLRVYNYNGKSMHIPFFEGEVEAMKARQLFEMRVNYTDILDENKELAIVICDNYDRILEDLVDSVVQYLEDHEVGKNDAQSAKLVIEHMPPAKSTQFFNNFVEENDLLEEHTLYKGVVIKIVSKIGRRMLRGYLKFIIAMHKSGWCWNGGWDESGMEVRDSGQVFVISTMAPYPASKDGMIEDLKRYIEILFPHYKYTREIVDPITQDKEYIEELPAYFDEFEKDVLLMPDPTERPECFQLFHKYMGCHLALMSPTAVSTLIDNLFKVADSQRPTADKAYAPMNEIIAENIDWIGGAIFQLWTSYH